ncbi:hypothetical protein J437_LFUL019636 [Ladona fulva]|uniref:Uncharacterized protein n=1 Tax=Ladona fulva TaxID=123851 RepID=A0A8K0KRB8_LADFU|nr:hypothetical protein J437_LFUL019636 [Ladona fulva]
MEIAVILTDLRNQLVERQEAKFVGTKVSMMVESLEDEVLLVSSIDEESLFSEFSRLKKCLEEKLKTDEWKQKSSRSPQHVLRLEHHCRSGVTEAYDTTPGNANAAGKASS